MGLFSSDVPVASVTDQLQRRVDDATAAITPATQPDEIGTDERALVSVRPFADSEGFDAAVEFARDLHRGEQTGETDQQAIEAMEWWFTDGQLRLRFCTATPSRFDRLVNARYEHSTVHTPERSFLDLRADEYVASAQLRLNLDCAFPIAHPNARLHSLDQNPYTGIASALGGPDDTRALVQCAFMPVATSWYQRGVWGSWYGTDVDDIADRRKDGTAKGEVNPRVVESEHSDRWTAMDMHAQRGKPAFQVAVRVVATGPTKAAVRERLEAVTSAFDAYSYPATEQGFTPDYLSTDTVTEGLAQAAGRDLAPQGWLKRSLFGRTMVVTYEELAGLVPLPNQSINAPLLDWARMESGTGTPGAGTQFGDAAEPSAPNDRTPDAQTNNYSPSQPADGLHTTNE